MSLGLCYKDVARAQIVFRLRVLRVREFDKLARAHQHRRLRGGVEVVRNDTRVGAADAHQPCTVRLAGLIGLCRIITLVLDQIPERLVVVLIVPNVRIVACRLHGLSDLLRFRTILWTQHDPPL